MKNLAKILVAACASLVFAQQVLGQASGLREGEAGAGLGGATSGEAPVTQPFLRGSWEGVMTIVGPEADGSPSSLPPFQGGRGQFGYRLEIGGDNLVMYFQSGADWISFGEGQDLRLNEINRSSVVIAALPAGNTIETMMLNIMRWEEDSILVHMSRTTGADGDNPPSVLNSMGMLTRAAN